MRTQVLFLSNECVQQEDEEDGGEACSMASQLR